jgi:hypothetical protein
MKATPTTRTTSGRVQNLTPEGIARRRLGNRTKRILGLDQLGDQVLISAPRAPTATSTLNGTKEFAAVDGNILATPDLNHVARGARIASPHLPGTTTTLVVRASHRRRCNGVIFIVRHSYLESRFLAHLRLGEDVRLLRTGTERRLAPRRLQTVGLEHTLERLRRGARATSTTTTSSGSRGSHFD